MSGHAKRNHEAILNRYEHDFATTWETVGQLAPDHIFAGLCALCFGIIIFRYV